MFGFLASLAIMAAAVTTVSAEQHTINLVNNCGFGTPTLILNGGIVSTGGSWTHGGPINGAIAYLQTGGCGFNGENCLMVETTLAGGFSSTDLTLIPPHAFSVTTGFGYWGGCDGAGADCTGPSCGTAFHQPSDTFVQV
ncbi:unnamed protein product, partial [Mycena citricolor]